MEKPIRVLIVEDSEDDSLLLLRTLRRGGYVPVYERVDTPEAMSRVLESDEWDVVITDYSMPRFSPFAALKLLKEHRLDLPLIIVSGAMSDDVGAVAMKAGANDYIMKSNLTRLIPAIERELRDAAERAARRTAEQQLEAAQQQFRVAREIQEALLPTAAPQLPGIDIAGVSHPANATGGDYFDYIPMQGSAIALAMGDVSGHGVGPAMLMAEIRAYLRLLAQTHQDVGEMLTVVNRFVTEDTRQDHFATLFLGRFAPESRQFEYASAGHPGYLFKADGNITVLEATSFPLGIDADERYETQALRALEPGELIFLHTDGSVEATSPDDEPFGIHRLLETVRSIRDKSAQEMIAITYELVRDFTGRKPQLDDIAVVLLKVDGVAAPVEFESATTAIS